MKGWWVPQRAGDIDATRRSRLLGSIAARISERQYGFIRMAYNGPRGEDVAPRHPTTHDANASAALAPRGARRRDACGASSMLSASAATGLSLFLSPATVAPASGSITVPILRLSVTTLPGVRVVPLAGGLATALVGGARGSHGGATGRIVTWWMIHDNHPTIDLNAWCSRQ